MSTLLLLLLQWRMLLLLDEFPASWSAWLPAARLASAASSELTERHISTNLQDMSKQ
jgi:hypothetical protein